MTQLNYIHRSDTEPRIIIQTVITSQEHNCTLQHNNWQLYQIIKICGKALHVFHFIFRTILELDRYYKLLLKFYRCKTWGMKSYKRIPKTFNRFHLLDGITDSTYNCSTTKVYYSNSHSLSSIYQNFK